MWLAVLMAAKMLQRMAQHTVTFPHVLAHVVGSIACVPGECGSGCAPAEPSALAVQVDAAGNP